MEINKHGKNSDQGKLFQERVDLSMAEGYIARKYESLPVAVML
jgi:hypothetical protein